MPTLSGNSLDVQTIREWLSPKDHVLRRLLENDRASRAEFTCEWFEPHLLEFCSSRNDMFLVTGASGCGKSVLSSWIIERLQRPLGRRSFDVISVKIGNGSSDSVNSIGPTLTSDCSCRSQGRGQVLQCCQKPLGTTARAKSWRRCPVQSALCSCGEVQSQRYHRF